jgi:hypothetical protein
LHFWPLPEVIAKGSIAILGGDGSKMKKEK